MPDTGRFDELYGAVTRDLMLWVGDEFKETRLDMRQAHWFLAELIPGFETEYTNWPHLTGDLRTYLTHFDAPRVHADLRLAAHVFLHIAYDLPRVIANTIDADPSVRSWGRAPFVRPNPRFLKVFLREMRSGRFGVAARLASQWDAAQMLGYWVIALRSVAWIHGEILADATGGLRPILEDRMARGLCEAGQLARQHRWLFGVDRLDSARLSSAVPFGAFVNGDVLLGAAAIAGTAAIIGGVTRAYYRRRV